FFQAEDGIRDGHVTGVQTCALPISVDEGHFQLYAQAIVPLAPMHPTRPRCEILLRLPDEHGRVETAEVFLPQAERHRLMPAIDRSEERRVGKEFIVSMLDTS